jgi:hypothetical protein
MARHQLLPELPQNNEKEQRKRTTKKNNEKEQSASREAPWFSCRLRSLVHRQGE